MGVRTDGKNNIDYFVDGNTVRKTETAYTAKPEYSSSPAFSDSPAYSASPAYRGIPVRRREPAVRPERQRSQFPDAAAGRNQKMRQQLMLADKLLIGILCAAVLVTIAITLSYLKLDASVDRRMSNVYMLEKRLETLRAENDAFEQSIDTSVDREHIYDVAFNQLHMVYPGQERTIRYQKKEGEYVRQYEEITEQR